MIYIASMNGKQVIKILQKNGWKVARIQGSHHMMVNGSKSCPVPVHGSQDLGIGLLKKIEKQTGLKLL